MYSVRVSRQAIKDIADLPRDRARQVAEHIDQLAEDPRPPGAKKLKGSAAHRVRVGDYRILYTIDDAAQLVIVHRVKHRREAYR